MVFSEQGNRPDRLWMESSSDGATHRLILAGELDLSSCTDLDTELLAAESSEVERIVVDLSEVDFIDSTGIAVLVAALRRAQQDPHRLRFIPSRSEDVQRLLEICGLEGHLPLAADEAGN